MLTGAYKHDYNEYSYRLSDLSALSTRLYTHRHADGFAYLLQFVHQLVELGQLRLVLPGHLGIVALPVLAGHYQQLCVVANPISGPAEMIVALCVVLVTEAETKTQLALTSHLERNSPTELAALNPIWHVKLKATFIETTKILNFHQVSIKSIDIKYFKARSLKMFKELVTYVHNVAHNFCLVRPLAVAARGVSASPLHKCY